MAEPGDPNRPDRTPDDHDDLIGFSSPASLAGRAREAEAAAAPAPSAPPKREAEPDLFDPRPSPALADVQAETTPAPAASAPATASAGSVFEPTEFSTKARRHDDPPALPKDGAGLFLGYALILFAVPTLGVSVVVGLLALMGRGVPDNAIARSHHQYQRRTLFAAAVAAVVGLVLIAAPFALGVPVLFLLAIWVILRGAAGVLALKAGRAIRHPAGWWI
ncbi:hypothetical protein [uncultured Brevundimonas sp.]|uniref:hypothetical protein n=1 Tax=uncultured Brevundimonas sp. TaxID=213418 RepID=UPI0025FBFC11|nr:hypothetical protein [uncultured Brevundimonas sp.]